MMKLLTIATLIGCKGNAHEEIAGSAAPRSVTIVDAATLDARDVVHDLMTAKTIDVEASDLASAYGTNEVSADARYKNRVLRVRGKVVRVMRGIGSESPIVGLDGDRKRDVVCGHVTDPNVVKILTVLQAGQTVVVRGVFNNQTPSLIALKPCMVEAIE